LRIEQVPPERVTAVWDLVRPGVETIKRKCPDYWRPEDVYSRLVANQATLFLVKDPQGFFVGEMWLEPFSKTPIFNVWLMYLPGAVGVDEVLQHHIDEIGRKAGCRRVRFVSPRPWPAIFKDKFKVTGVIYERDL
jgi:hypothetical protein